MNIEALCVDITAALPRIIFTGWPPEYVVWIRMEAEQVTRSQNLRDTEKPCAMISDVSRLTYIH